MIQTTAKLISISLYCKDLSVLNFEKKKKKKRKKKKKKKRMTKKKKKITKKKITKTSYVAQRETIALMRTNKNSHQILLTTDF